MNLRFIFDELCKGNLSVLTLEAQEYISSEVLRILSNNEVYMSGNIKDTIELLCMIGNITYNRTDLAVLPISDETYDRLINLYKLLDPNFQVGSVVVEFKTQAQKVMKENNEIIIDPLKFKHSEERDVVREYYADRIMSFDKGAKYTHDEIFGEKLPLWDQGDISKRLHDTKHNHPQLVGTLDKAKYVLDADAIEMDLYDDPSTTILERDFFWKHIKEGIITEDQEIQLVLELKYDGISVEADCTDRIESARTRGDTGIGEASDITPILYGYKFPRNTVLKDKEIGVKFEAIIKYTDLGALNKERGTDYVNARMAIIGIMNSSDGYKYRDYITLVPLAVDRDQVPEVKNRMEEIELLNSLFRTKGEPLRYCYIQGNYQSCLFLIKKFLEEARYAREYLNFMFDGIVVSYLDEDIRNKLGRENFVNKYSIAVKFDPLSVLTTFFGYTFNVGQSGNICPMIHYAPVEFIGTIHDKSSGSSVKRFTELALKPGDIIEVSYNNDVMPYVKKVDNEHNRHNKNPLVEFPKVCPCCGTPLRFSNTGDSAKCPNWYCDGRVIARMAATFDKLGFTGFAESTAEALKSAGVTNISDIRKISRESMVKILGNADGNNFYDAFDHLVHTPIKDYVVFAALGFSNIGKGTWKKVFMNIDVAEFVDSIEKCIESEDSIIPDDLWNKVCKIKGVGGAFMDTICREYQYFRMDIRYIMNVFNIVHLCLSAPIDQKIIRFTGCRNQKLEKLLCDMGHDADGAGGVTKSTDILIVPYSGFQSTKVNKVSENALVIPLVDFVVSFDTFIDCEGYDEMKIQNTLGEIAEELAIEITRF